MKRPVTLPHLIQLRLGDESIERIDDWRRHQRDIPTRSEAIRRLLAIGLGAERPRPSLDFSTEPTLWALLAQLYEMTPDWKERYGFDGCDASLTVAQAVEHDRAEFRRYGRLPIAGELEGSDNPVALEIMRLLARIDPDPEARIAG